MSDFSSDAAHARYKDMLERHIDGELGADERAQLFEHLEQCTECQQILEAEERLTRRLSQLPRLHAPSDLRAQILRSVKREQRENNELLDADERYATVFAEPKEQAPSEPELTLFAETPGRAPRRRRRARPWQRYRQPAAMTFLAVAAFASLLTGDFRQLPLLARFQAVVRNAFESSVQVASAALGLGGGASTESPTQLQASAPPAATPTPIPPPAEPETTVPSPAEQKGALLAIVLRPTDPRQAPGFGSPDDLGDTIRQTAEASLQGKFTAEDRFVYDGHRYHCYTLQMPGERFEQLVRVLDRYRASVDQPILEAISEQSDAQAQEDNVAFFCAARQDLKAAVARSSPVPTVASLTPRQVRIFIVE